MADLELDAARNRTDSKLRYAEVHLAELRQTRRGGDDFDRAHQESFLFHLFGVRDALLQEMNVRHGAGLDLRRVSRKTLAAALAKARITSTALQHLAALEDDPSSWISTAAELRHHSTHRRDVPRLFHKGGDHDGEVYLTDTLTGNRIEKDFVLQFAEWLDEMRELVDELRRLM